ncbi:MAG: GNAT family N-acetyltransferase [Anaerolineaceae bacterium]
MLPFSIPITKTLEIKGLNFRNVLGEEDAELIYQLRKSCVEQDQVDLLSASEGLPSIDEIRLALISAKETGQLNNRLLAEIDQEVVGYSMIDSWYEMDERWVYLILGWVKPKWRNYGLGTALLRWGETVAKKISILEHPGERFEFAANSNTTQIESTRLLLNEGYQVGYTVLEMSLDFSKIPPISPLPTGVEIRPVRPEHNVSIAISIGESYQNEYENHRFQNSWDLYETISRLSESSQNPDLWQIAWIGNEVVGNVIPLVEKGRAIMYDISVRPALRGKGLARALLTRSLWDLRYRGIDVIRLNTVKEFPTRAYELYKSVGFRILKEFPRFRKSGA